MNYVVGGGHVILFNTILAQREGGDQQPQLSQIRCVTHSRRKNCSQLTRSIRFVMFLELLKQNKDLSKDPFLRE